MVSYTHCAGHLLVLLPDPISILHPTLAPGEWIYINYKSKLMSSGFLWGSPIGGSGTENKIGKFIFECLSWRGHCKLAAFLYQRSYQTRSDIVPCPCSFNWEWLRCPLMPALESFTIFHAFPTCFPHFCKSPFMKHPSNYPMLVCRLFTAGFLTAKV